MSPISPNYGKMDGDDVLVFLASLVCAWMAQGMRAHMAGWHRELFRRYWRWRSRYRGGRPRIDRALIALIRRISWENPLWGAPRIHGELLALGYRVAQSTVSKYMLRRGHGRPGAAWSGFLRAHADNIAAIDMLSVPSLGFGRLYAFIVLAHRRRKILHVEASSHPTAFWLACQVAEAFGRDPAPFYVVRDNDGLYGAHFRQALRAMGLRDRPTQPASPWQNGHVERLIGSIRRECLDHLLIRDAGHLRRVLRAYADYYNTDRTHLALAKDSPVGRAVEHNGRIIAQPVLGGLHHRYRRRALK